MKRTSLTHPLEIAALSAGPVLGRVGITFCPGKYDRQAMTGYWDRDLSIDLDAIRNWGAAAVVTLLEPKEILLLRVEHLGEEVRRRGILWFHLPIADVSTPDEGFERSWVLAGDALRTLLRNGRDVLVHCRGGLGRAGTIATRLLIELGMEPAIAISRVRAVRPGAIETREQEKYVLGTLRGLLQIGVHQDVEVTDSDAHPPQLVSQAFCAALPVAYCGYPSSMWRPFAELVLDAAYEATVLAGVLNARRGTSNIVLLTRLGGGAFGNDDAWIDAAMRRALKKVRGLDLDVRLVSFGSPAPTMLETERIFS
jgi:protein-tyrosine phosphatase